MNLNELVEKINPDVNDYVNIIFSTVESAIKNFDWEFISKDSLRWRGIFKYWIRDPVSREIGITSFYGTNNRNNMKYVYITEWAFRELILNEKLGSIPYCEVRECLPLMVKKGIIASVHMDHEIGSLYIGIWLE